MDYAVSGMRIITLDETDSSAATSKRMHISYNLICHARDMRRRSIKQRVPAVTKARVPAESAGFLLFAVSPVSASA